MDNSRLQWHPGFSAALRITLGDEMAFLEMQEEFLLNKKPPQIDVLILKKKQEISIRKQIGELFRGHNIIEYKSPGDNLSINDFYKVYGYACFYQSNTDHVCDIDPSNLTITFVCSHFPKSMLEHLHKVRGISAEEHAKGIFYLSGDPFPMQILLIPALDPAENFWLHNLRTDLKAGEEIRTLMRNYEKNRTSKDYAAVMNLITRANWKQMEVEKKMCDALKELFAEELKEADSRGRDKGIQMAKKIFRLSAKGTSIRDIADACGISADEVREILK